MSNVLFAHLIILLAIIIVASSESVIDEITSKGRPIEHGWSAIFRLISVATVNFIVFDGYIYPSTHTIIGLGLYWFVFDAVFGYRRKSNPFYVGNTAFLDKLQRKTIGIGADAFIMFKVLVTAIALGINYLAYELYSYFF